MDVNVLSYCRITNGKIVVNDRMLPVSTDVDTTKWLSNVYHEQNMLYPKFFKMDNLCKTGFLSAELLLHEVCFDRENVKPDWSVVCVERSSSLDDDRIFQNTIRESDKYYPSPAVFVYTLANIVTGELSIRYKLGGESSCYVMEEIFPSKFRTLMCTPFRDKTTHYVLGGWVDYLDNQCDALLMLLSDKDVSKCSFNEEFVLKTYGILP